MRATASCRIQFALITSNQYFILLFLAYLQAPRIAFFKLFPKRNLNSPHASTAFITFFSHFIDFELLLINSFATSRESRVNSSSQYSNTESEVCCIVYLWGFNFWRCLLFLFLFCLSFFCLCLFLFWSVVFRFFVTRREHAHMLVVDSMVKPCGCNYLRWEPCLL